MNTQTQSTPVSSFTFINLTDSEALRGQILNTDQKNVIYNLRAAIAEQILNLRVDTTNIVEFAQKDAHLKGQLETYSFLIDSSDFAEKEVLERAKAQS